MKQGLFIFIVLVLGGCINPPDFPDEPVLTFTGLSTTSMDQGKINEDFVKVFFSFTDGDGDLGQPNNQGNGRTFDVFIKDLRTGIVQESLFFPYIPPKGASNGVEGTGEILIFTTCCLPEAANAPCEPGINVLTNDLQYEIYVIDRDGNESNRMVTDIITLNCN